MTIYNSTPAAPEATPRPRMDPARLEAIRAYVTEVVRNREAMGFYPDGRLADMAKYSEYLREQMGIKNEG